MPASLVAWATGSIDVHALSTAITHREWQSTLVWAAPIWAILTPVIAGLGLVGLDARAESRGRTAQEKVQRQLTPIAAWRRRRAQRDADAAGPMHPTRGYFLGRDERGTPVHVPPLRTHATILGGSGTGKTNTAEALLEAHVAAGGNFIALDGKGGRDLPATARHLQEKYGRPFLLWSIHRFGDERLDERRVPWNPLGFGNATELKDRIASSEEQSEPYYAEIAERGLLAACAALSATGPIDLGDVAGLLQDPQRLVSALRIEDHRHVEDMRWLASLDRGELSALRGMGLRLHTMRQSEGGEWLSAVPPENPHIDLYHAIREGWNIVFTLPEGTYPRLVPKVPRYALSTLNAVCTRLEQEGHKANTIAFIDELSAFQGDQLAATYERGRSAGIHVVAATQSLGNFESVGGAKLLNAALDNSELVIVHRQQAVDAPDKLAAMGGTHEVPEESHQVGGHAWTRWGRASGRDETGLGNRKFVQEFRIHPNRIRDLQTGQAVIISSRMPEAPVVIMVNRGPSARKRA